MNRYSSLPSDISSFSSDSPNDLSSIKSEKEKKEEAGISFISEIKGDRNKSMQLDEEELEENEDIYKIIKDLERNNGKKLNKIEYSFSKFDTGPFTDRTKKRIKPVRKKHKNKGVLKKKRKNK